MGDLDNTKYYNIINKYSGKVVATGKFKETIQRVRDRDRQTHRTIVLQSFTDLKYPSNYGFVSSFDVKQYDFEPLSSSGGRRRSRKHTKSRRGSRSTNRRHH